MITRTGSITLVSFKQSSKLVNDPSRNNLKGTKLLEINDEDSRQVSY